MCEVVAKPTYKYGATLEHTIFSGESSASLHDEREGRSSFREKLYRQQPRRTGLESRMNRCNVTLSPDYLQ